MKSLIAVLLSVLVLSSCTTSYLTDDDSNAIGYDGRENAGEYKKGKRKNVTVKEPLIQNINEPAPDLVALPVEKVAVKNLSLEDGKAVEVAADEDIQKQDLSTNVKTEIKAEADENSGKSEKTETDEKSVSTNVDSATVLAVTEIKTNEIINLPEENEKIEKNPPAEPDIKEKTVISDNSVSEENIDDNANILTLLYMVKFKSSSSRLSDGDNKGIKNTVVAAQKAEDKKLKIIIYAPYDYEKISKKLYNFRKNNTLKALEKFGVKKDKIVAEIEETNVKEMFNRAEFYIEY